MDYKKWYKIFNDYAEKYNLKEKWLMYKFHHTYRVIEYSKEIANSLSLTKEDIDIVVISSLLHDIARFKQYTEYKTFVDELSFDHGDEAIKILRENDFIKEFTKDEEIIRIVFNAIKNHNKIKIDDMDDKSILITNILRDADKLDIMIEIVNSIDDDIYIIDDKAVDAIINGNLIVKSSNDTDVTIMLTYISFIYDLNYKYSFKLLEDKKILENKFNVLDIYIKDERIEKMKQVVSEYVKERLTC